MKIKIIYGVLLCLALIHVTLSLPLQDDEVNEIEQKALEFVKSAEEKLQELSVEGSDLAWAYNTNITDYNEEKQKEFKVSLYLLLLCTIVHTYSSQISGLCLMK